MRVHSDRHMNESNQKVKGVKMIPTWDTLFTQFEYAYPTLGKTHKSSRATLFSTPNASILMNDWQHKHFEAIHKLLQKINLSRPAWLQHYSLSSISYTNNDPKHLNLPKSCSVNKDSTSPPWLSRRKRGGYMWNANHIGHYNISTIIWNILTHQELKLHSSNATSHDKVSL